MRLSTLYLLYLWTLLYLCTPLYLLCLWTLLYLLYLWTPLMLHLALMNLRPRPWFCLRSHVTRCRNGLT